jgi:RNA processing factor Prp31
MGNDSRITEIDDIEKFINENSSEQRRLTDLFRKSMTRFAEDRSIETCLDALNISIQLASTRKKLMESYEQYARLLEVEIVKLRQICKKIDDQQHS